MLKLVLLGINILFVAGQCPTSWDMHGNSCYFFSHDAESWIVAMKTCRSGMFMADLVTVDDSDESMFIHTQMSHIANAKAFWVGANDMVNEGAWLWGTSNKTVTFQGWLPGEPNNMRGEENCAIVVPKPAGWYDIECNAKVPYICERPA